MYVGYYYCRECVFDWGKKGKKKRQRKVLEVAAAIHVLS